MRKILLITLIFSTVYTNAQCWESISVGEQHCMGIQTNGTLWGWGNGQIGLLGNGSESPSSSPEQIGTATDWREVYAGAAHSFGVQDNGTLWGWGEQLER